MGEDSMDKSEHNQASECENKKVYRKPVLTCYQKMEAMTRGDSPPGYTFAACKKVGGCGPESQPVF